MGMHIRFMNRCGGWCESTVDGVDAPACSICARSPRHRTLLAARSRRQCSFVPTGLTAVTISARWMGKLAGLRFMGVKRRDGDAGTEGKKGEHYAFRICPVGAVDTGR